MTFLGTLLRGLRARAWLSGGSLLLTAVAIGSAMLGPVFADAVTASYAVSRLDDAPNTATGLSYEFAPGPAVARRPGPRARAAAS